jgi:hypothetical protein
MPEGALDNPQMPLMPPIPQRAKNRFRRARFRADTTFVG